MEEIANIAFFTAMGAKDAKDRIKDAKWHKPIFAE
jgi:hypothetical protein